MELINYISFNQNASCVSVGTSLGYKLFATNPFVKAYTRNFRSISIVEMLHVTSLLVIVAAESNGDSSARRLKVVNTKRQTVICELVFPSEVKKVKLNSERMVVLLESQIYIYEVATMRLLHTMDTCANPQKLLVLSSVVENNFLAYPSTSLKNDYFFVMDRDYSVLSNDDSGLGSDSETSTGTGDKSDYYDKNDSTGSADSSGQSLDQSHNSNKQANDDVPRSRDGDVIIFNAQTLERYRVISAHKAALAAIAISFDGLLLATASSKGTIIRVFSVRTGEKLYQFRRGTYGAKIINLCFSNDNKFVTASSATGTVHIFKLSDEFQIKPEAKVHVAKKTRKRKQKPKPTEAKAKDAESEAEADSTEPVDADADANSAVVVDTAKDLFEGDNKVDGSTSESGSTNDESGDSVPPLASEISEETKAEPIIDQTRSSVGRLIRKSSQSLGRRAAETMGIYLPRRVTSVLKPIRHFASLKIPVPNGTFSIVAIKKLTSEIPEDILSKLNIEPEPAEDTSDVSIREKNMLEVMIVTKTGLFLSYALDGERGGDCILLHQHLLTA